MKAFIIAAIIIASIAPAHAYQCYGSYDKDGNYEQHCWNDDGSKDY